MNSTNIRPLIGLLGVFVAALSADLNEFVSGRPSSTTGAPLASAQIPASGSTAST